MSSLLQTPFKIHDENVYNPTAKSGQKLTNSVMKKGLSDSTPMIPGSTVKGLKTQIAPKSTRKALSNVSQSQINSRQTVSISLDPTTVSKSKRMDPVSSSLILLCFGWWLPYRENLFTGRLLWMKIRTICATEWPRLIWRLELLRLVLLSPILVLLFN